MLYLTIIGIVCAAVATVGTLGISNETGMNRAQKSGSRRLLCVTSESFKLDLSDDLDAEDVVRTRRITTRLWKRKRSVKTNLKDVAADAEIDMNKRIEKLARESSQRGVVEDGADGVATKRTVRDAGSRSRRRAHKKRRRFMLNPFKWKPGYSEQSTQNSAFESTTDPTPKMGVFERKMKEFHDQQKTKQKMPWPAPTTQMQSDDVKYKEDELTTESSTQWVTHYARDKEETPTTFLPPYVLESTNYALQSDDELTQDRYLKIRHALRNYLMRTGKGCGRRKRCNRPYCVTRKCKKAPPMVCLPFIKRGQDEMLRFMITLMQSMLDRSCNSRKPYPLNKIRCTTCRPDDNWDNAESDSQTGCETTTPCPCPKMAPCGPFAILPFPLPFPPCACPTTSTTATIPTCPPICVPPPPTTPIIPLPPLPPPCPIICPDIPKSRPCDTPPTMIIPTYFPPWPTTKSPCLRPINSNFIPMPCPEPLPPWPTPPPFIKTSPYRRRIPIYRQRVNKMIDYPELNRNEISNPVENKANKYEFESVYDSPEQETIEEAEIDIRSHHFDYDPENSIDFSVFDMSTPSYEQTKVKKFPRRSYRRRYPKTEFPRRFDRRYMSLRQKRDEASEEEPDTTATTVTTSKTTESDNSNHRDQYDSLIDKKRVSTMRSAVIVRGPKRPSNHPQAKVFAKVFPESYSDLPAESSTMKVDKTTVTQSANSSSLMHLQLLAVCEGYLQMIKLLKVNNQSHGDDDLVRYCENEISRNFDSGREKKSIDSTTVATSTVRSSTNSKKSIRNKVVVDILRSPIYREMRSHFLAKNAGRAGMRERRRRRKKRRRGFRRKPYRRTTTENVDSVRLLRKRKGALVSWLFNKENAEVEEEEEDGGGRADVGNATTTSSVRRKETSATPQPETVYPIYAKMYGYDKGELSDIEVLLRSLNERNETREIAKNVTVLAMLMNPEDEERDTGLVEEGDSELKHDSAQFGGKARGEIDRKKGNGSTSTVASDEEVNEMIEEEETTLTEVGSSEATTVLGHPTTEAPRKNHTWNGTYAQAVSSAKELVKDYTIEFLNYAVYIIPIMFILLFLVCCLCFILKIMTHNRKKRKRGRGKRKDTTPPSSDSDSETSESSINRKRKKSKAADSKRRSKKLWSSMKARGASGDDDGRKLLRRKRKTDGIDSDDRKFLKRLRRKKKELEGGDEYDENEERALVSGKKRVSYNDSNDTDGPDTRLQRHRDDVARERRELIALLEELKNLEDRDRKDSKSVFVQYMTTDYDDTESNYRQCRDRNNVDNFRRMSRDLSDELVRGTAEDVAHKFELLTRMFDRLPLSDVSPRKKTILMDEIENFRRRFGCRKHTRLKDNGVLCRP